MTERKHMPNSIPDITNPDQAEGLTGWEYHLSLLWKSRLRLAVIVFLAAVAGVLYSLTLPALYKTSTVIQPKATNQQAILSLGGLGGEAGAQLSRIEVVLTSRDLAADMLQRHPNLAKEILPEKVDKKTGGWKKGVPPTFLEKTGRLRSLLNVSTNLRKNFLTLDVETQDPALSKRVSEAYLESLNFRLREMVNLDADSNQAYLVRQLEENRDPLLRERILSLMGAQLERSMQINARSFEVIEQPVLLDNKTGPSRRKIVVMALLVGVFLGIAMVYLRPVLAFIRARLKRLARG